MNTVAVYISGRIIYWNAVIIALGIAACFFMTVGLWKRDEGHKSAGILAFFLLSLALGVVLGRFVHWYTHIEQYSVKGMDMKAALTNFTTGSYCIPGVLIGVMLAALIVKLIRLSPTAGELLDAAAPGLTLLIALIRLSELFTEACRSKIIILNKTFQCLPWAVSTGKDWRLATFFLEFIILIFLTFIIGWLFTARRHNRMRKGVPASGHVFRLFLVFYGAIEIISDSTRNDSPLMHFNLLKMLNPYASFISVVQLFAAISILVIFIRYICWSARARGFSWYHILLIVLLVASLVGVGYLGEYKVQRTGLYVRCYAFQGASLLIMAMVVLTAYLLCKRKKKKAPPKEA